MRPLAPAILPLLLAGCGETPPEPTPTPTPTVAAPRVLIAADFDPDALGPRIVGPQGPEVGTALSSGNDEFGRMESYVACPRDVTECLPASLPEGTIYTYVHRVILGEAAEDGPGSDAVQAERPPSTGATLFRTVAPVTGFANAIGYDKDEAEFALGSADAITVTYDEGTLIWRVTEGSGWTPGTAITFWWQSTVAPRGPEKAFLVEIDGKEAPATGPFPQSAPASPSPGLRPPG